MDGTVEWVRLIGHPQTVHDTMWLSAVKAWQFQPAFEDGIPVRYLKDDLDCSPVQQPRSPGSTFPDPRLRPRPR